MFAAVMRPPLAETPDTAERPGGFFVKRARLVMLAIVLAATLATLAVLQGGTAPTASVTLSQRVAARPPATRQATGVASATKSPAFSLPATPLHPDYQPLLGHSLFSAQRDNDKPEPETEAELAAAQAKGDSQEASLVLCGVAEQGGEYTVLVEDVTSHRVSRLGVGAFIGRGRLASVNLDGVGYEVGGRIRHVRIGDDLTGRTPAFAANDAPKPSKAVARNSGKKKPEPEPATPGHVDPQHASRDERNKDERNKEQRNKEERIKEDRMLKEAFKSKEKGYQELKLKGAASVALPGKID
jgi:hypothetical protein